jgi:hypothetical protein
MSPHYDRPQQVDSGSIAESGSQNSGLNEEVMAEAAEALRVADVESVQEEVREIDPVGITPEQLEQMSIDELRALAAVFNVPDRAQITEQDELIAEIKKRL